MNSQILFIKYINKIKKKKLLTQFIANIFDYHNITENNYIFRIKKENNYIIMDIYDNISKNKLNKYIFDYSKSNNNIKKTKKDGIYITHIYMQNIKNSNIKLYKLAYLFTLNKKDMIEYAKTFLDNELVNILKGIIK